MARSAMPEPQEGRAALLRIFSGSSAGRAEEAEPAPGGGPRRPSVESAAPSRSLLDQLGHDYPDLASRTIGEALDRAWLAMSRLDSFACNIEGGIASLARDDLNLTRARMNAAGSRVGLPGFPCRSSAG
jgi:hypothetical protein